MKLSNWPYITSFKMLFVFFIKGCTKKKKININMQMYMSLMYKFYEADIYLSYLKKQMGFGNQIK